MVKIKNFLKLFIPPIILSFFRFFKKKIEKNIYSSLRSKQSLDVYYEEKMAHTLETWAERNAWIEIQHLLLNKNGKILDIACGSGKVIEILSKINIKDVYGCDISDFLIEKAIERGISASNIDVIIILRVIDLKRFLETSIDNLLYPETICGSFGSSLIALPCKILSGQYEILLLTLPNMFFIFSMIPGYTELLMINI